jgi:hypothetical protein
VLVATVEVMVIIRISSSPIENKTFGLSPAGPSSPGLAFAD